MNKTLKKIKNKVVLNIMKKEFKKVKVGIFIVMQTSNGFTKPTKLITIQDIIEN